MKWIKRIGLLIVVNILVMVTITTVLSLLGLNGYASSSGIDMGSLAAFCLVWGFGGALISLAISRIMAKWMMGVRIIEATTRDSRERWLMETVHGLARRAGLTTMPQVGIYDGQELNAFATGPTRNRALVAVSTGLLESMDASAVEGVVGHEIAHIANGDMVTMTLVQGVVNSFVMFLSRLIAFAVSQNVREESRYMVRWIVTIVLEIALSLLGAMVVAYFSRRREFRADAGGARFAGREKMVGALQALQRVYGAPQGQEAGGQSMATLKISGKSGGFMALLSTHPPLEDRIAALQKLRI